ncbi:tRNA lysidine(34) synthetase TilS [Maribacter polysiphoniae]|uniref:tRNA(Ile)-lysidine synthase n=1 Tax=Maribacter polysiphoniae TaxID=429344 RepID=A0A316DWA3_9FLAO|nr:tRNA lysidine(34) synthetase TilS [Maribacter polysiphoniae]MBD1262048.1 tRNA lysidine(34) synthetase TilS [Maribacter polysiphoniae]PWK21738.1 tRNA(Ile)-lysidine synthase [Maribacter polysiphoniae]
MQNEFRKHIEEHFPELLQNKFLLACSGGLDSVVLAHLCNQCGLDFSLAHCNFQLRGTDSDQDEQFVRELAKQLNKSLWVEHFNTKAYVNDHKVSVQMAARELRYDWFKDLMAKHQIKTLVTAHHADDNLETFLINLSRGTGLKGLSGIPAKTDMISRPLLPYSRVQLSEYAKENNIQWREDRSNAETKYLRNKIRHDIIPLLKETHPTFLHNFQTTQRNLQQIVAISDIHLSNLKKELFREDGEVVRISTEALLALDPIGAYMYGLFNAYGFTAWSDVVQLITAMSGKEIRSKTHRLLKDRDELILGKIEEEQINSYTIEETTTAIEEPVAMTITLVNNIGETGPDVLYIDKETLKYPLVLRKRQKGDYFYPLGMQGRKKLSKFFKDEKMDVFSKEKQWLLCSDTDIVWVVGKRLDNRFKITPSTKKILKITLN